MKLLLRLLLLTVFLKELSFSEPLYSQNEALNNDSPSNPSIIESEPHKVLIIGRWRGFYEQDDFTMYYFYDFYANGNYLARHRVYQGEKTILDEFWQGKWDFDGKIVSLEGIRTIDKNPIPINYQFQLNEDNFLYYQEGALSEPYIPRKMGKLGKQ